MSSSKRRKIGVFTIASKNYLAYVRVLLASVRQWNPDYKLFLCLADKVEGAFDVSQEDFEVIEADSIGIRHMADMAVRYDIMEFNTAIKPFVFQHLLDSTDLDSVIYLDPDIRVFAPLSRLEAELEGGPSVVLTPHLTRPIEDGKNPNDYHILQTGVFNLGFMAINRCQDARRFVDWWARRLQTQAHADFGRNLFTDQRWCDLAPCFVERLSVFKAAGYNVAYWNLTERKVEFDSGRWTVNGEPLTFFHFSGVNASAENVISKHQNRYTWSDLPQLKPLFDAYRAALVDAGWGHVRDWRYAYASTSTGLPLKPLMRSLYAQAHPEPVDSSAVDLTQAVLEACNAPAGSVLEDDDIVVTRLMAQIHGQRVDLQCAFNLMSPEGRRGLREWFASAGPREYGLPGAVVPSDSPPAPQQRAHDQAKGASRAAGQVVQAPLGDGSLAELWKRLPSGAKRRAAPLIAATLAAQRQHGPAAQDDRQAVARAPAGARPAANPGFSALTTRIDALEGPADVPPWLGDRYISVLMQLIWSSRTDLCTAFDLQTAEGQEAFAGWYEASAEREYGLASKIPTRQHWARRGEVVQRPAASAGANLIGYAHAELGMGEHVRMSAAALEGTGVPFGVVNFNVGVASRQQAVLEHGRLATGNPHVANLFHINADQMLLAFCTLGHEFFRGRYNIGYWAWELAHCPDAWAPVMRVVDEVWAPSRFIQSAFAAKADIPVVYMPLCVTLPRFPTLPRRSFGIRDNAFTFLYTFDFFSFLARKNPFAAIRAFHLAFPRGDEEVCLVLKVMNGDPAAPQWRKMLELIRDDPRIIVINRTMGRNEVLALFEASDCFLSLHRSEGFGRGPAEAMYLGKPVIVTNYSGNTDFTKADNACLVDYRLIPVQEGEYPLHDGQEWADADVDHAAWHMRRLVADRALAKSIGERGRDFVRTNFSPAAIGQRYAQRLRELGLAP